jgi:hypothetical protein
VQTEIKFEAISRVKLAFLKQKRTYDDDLFVDGTLWNAGPFHVAIPHVVALHRVAVAVFSAKIVTSVSTASLHHCNMNYRTVRYAQQFVQSKQAFNATPTSMQAYLRGPHYGHASSFRYRDEGQVCVLYGPQLRDGRRNIGEVRHVCLAFLRGTNLGRGL